MLLKACLFFRININIYKYRLPILKVKNCYWVMKIISKRLVIESNVGHDGCFLRIHRVHIKLEPSYPPIVSSMISFASAGTQKYPSTSLRLLPVRKLDADLGKAGGVLCN